MKDNIMLQLPTEIVRNITGKLDEKAFIIYAYLMYQKFKNYNKSEFDVLLTDIKAATTITDNRTIKKCLSSLFEQGLIQNEFDKLPINKPLHITMLEPYKKDYFTQLPLELFKIVDVVGIIGFRLIYYYESYINRKSLKTDFCYPSYETIRDDLMISNHSIAKYNKLLSSKNLITVTKHKVESSPFGDSGLERYNNHYRVNVEQLRKEG